MSSARVARRSLTSTTSPSDESNPYFTYDPAQCIVCSRCVRACEEVQGTFALTIEGRGFESQRRGRHGRGLPRFRMRVLRRLRAGLPDRCAAREDGARDRPAGAFGGHHLRLLRRRLLVQGRDARRRGHAHGALQGRQGQPRPFLRQGPLRLGLRHPQGPHPEADDPREDHRSLARGELGGGDRATSPREFRRIQYQYGRDAIGGITSSRCTNEETYLVQKLVRAGLRQQQCRHLRPRLPFADRLRPEARPSAPRPARRISTRVEQTDVVDRSSAPTRPTAIRCSPRG